MWSSAVRSGGSKRVLGGTEKSYLDFFTHGFGSPMVMKSMLPMSWCFPSGLLSLRAWRRVWRGGLREANLEGSYAMVLVFFEGTKGLKGLEDAAAAGEGDPHRPGEGGDAPDDGE